jgi:O-antigen ligase
MTSHMQISTAILQPASLPSERLATALERLAYASLCAFVFAMPWEQSPQLGGFLVGRWFGLAAFGIAILHLAVSGRVRKLSVLHYWMMALVGWSALSILWTIDWDGTVVRIGTYLQLLIAVWLIWELASVEIRILGLLQAYVLGIFVSSSTTIYNFLMGITASQLYAERGLEKWDSDRFSISGVNENDLGLMLALSLPMAIYLAARRNRTLESLFYWIQITACITAIFLTGSRGALLAVAVSLLMFPLALPRLPRWQKVAALAACGGIIAGATFLVPGETWQRILKMGSEISQGTLTHRTLIWGAGMEAFRDHAFLGVGSGAYGLSVLRALDVPYVAHNTFLSVLVELGVIGALLLFALLAGLFYCAIRMRYLERCLWVTLLMTWAVGVSALTWEYRKPTWLLFGLLAAHAYVQRAALAPVMRRSQGSREAGRLRPRVAASRVLEGR